MRFFEILGKLALLAAGLSAIVDLVDQKKFQRWSCQADEYAQRRSDYRKIARIAHLRSEATLLFFRTIAGPTMGGGGTQAVFMAVRTTPPRKAPSGLDDDAFIAFWHTVMDELRDCGLRDAVSREEDMAALSLVERRIDEFLRRELPESEGRLVGSVAGAENRGFLLTMGLLCAMVMVLPAVDLERSTWTVPGQAALTVEGIGIPLIFGTAVVLAFMPTIVPGIVEVILFGAAARFLRLLAKPVRPVRIGALVLFVGGSLIDLAVLLLK